MAECNSAIRWLTGSLMTGLLLFATSLSAHEQNTAMTTVLFNPRSGNIEVMHQFSLHDAEHGVRRLSLNGSNEVDLHASQSARDAFSNYVSQRFYLSDPNDELLPLTLVGSEVEDNSLWVYQETSIPESLQGLIIRHHVLREIWPEQVNRVNVEQNDSIQTVIFLGDIEQQAVTFD